MSNPRPWMNLLRPVIAGLRTLVLPVVGGLLAYFLIPIALSRYDDVRSLREARLARAVKFGDRNAEFYSKIHAEATLLRMSVSHNDRMNLSGAELKEARKDLTENYRSRYLEIDGAEWWWPWEFVREVSALDMLSKDEMTELKKLVGEYGESANRTIYEPIYLWQFLDSPKYEVRGKKSKDEIKRLDGNIDKVFKPEYDKRAELVEKITELFERSNYRTGWREIAGFR